MAFNIPEIENLVFEGGGVRGIAYAGALNVLQEYDILQGVKRAAGTSAGAFTALLLCMDYSPDEVRNALRSIHFETLEDSPNPIRVVTKYGLYKGQVLYDWIAAQVANKGLPEDLTFDALRRQGGRELKVFATDLNIQNTREFSAEATPDTSVVGAVRASMSIPLMYSAWQFPDGIPNDHLYVDGGAVYNYPIAVYDSLDAVNDRTLGFCFTGGAQEGATSRAELSNLFEFSRVLFATILSAQKIDFAQDPDEVRRSVRIDDLGYKATDLNLSDEGFERLYKAGQEATRNYLQARTHL